MHSKSANMLKVFTIEAPTLLELEDKINEWLQDQPNGVVIEDISYQHGGDLKHGNVITSSAMIVADVRAHQE